jgi:hypothetical protein
MGAFHGIQVYEILDNGNILNAIYTNTDLLLNNGNYHIDSEIVIKKPYGKKGVEGFYECRYIETDIETNNPSGKLCDLEILKHNGVFVFKWSKEDKPIWNGLGLMAGTTHISVSYVNP